MQSTADRLQDIPPCKLPLWSFNRHVTKFMGEFQKFKVFLFVVLFLLFCLQPPLTCLPCQSFLKSLHFFTHCSTRVEQVIPLHLCETSDVHALYPSMDLQFLLFVFHKTHTCVQALKMGSWILCSLKEIERGSVITLSHTLPSPTYPTVVPAWIWMG